MNKVLTTGAALLLSSTSAHAIGLDRSGQDIGIIFETGNYVELSFGSVMPDVTGNDVAIFGGGETGNVAEDFTQVGLGLRYQINDQVAIALIYDQPFGSDVSYSDEGGVAFGGTEAFVDSNAITLMGQYRINPNFSVHAGIKYQTISADVILDGAAYGTPGPTPALRDYEFEQDGGVGVVAGVAYERPDIALRVALTYHSQTSHDLATSATFDPDGTAGPTPVVTLDDGDTRVITPESWNLDFQTGVAPGTLVFGSVRYARYSQTLVRPATLGGTSLTDIDDGLAYSLGVGRAFSDNLRGSISVGYEPEGSSSLVSPLSPTNGNTSISIGMEYDVTDQVTIGAGVRYTNLGDADARFTNPADGTTIAGAEFEDNDVVAVGVNIGYSF